MRNSHEPRHLSCAVGSWTVLACNSDWQVRILLEQQTELGYKELWFYSSARYSQSMSRGLFLRLSIEIELDVG